MNAAARISTVPPATDPRHQTTRNGQGEAMTRLQLSGTGHIVLGLIALWRFLILATAMMVGTAE
jgi:hypothetical protein